jgi:hypothetical protein
VDGSERSRRLNRHGWWGVGFVVLLLVSESAVALPEASRSSSAIAAYYEQHPVAVTFAQLGRLVASYFFFRFSVALYRGSADRQEDPGASARLVSVAGVGIVAASVVTTVPALVLALVLSLPLSLPLRATRAMASAGDLTDVLLFVAIAVFAMAVGTSPHPRLVRVFGLVLSLLAAGRAALGLAHVSSLDAIAPVAFGAFVLVLSIRLMRMPGPRPTPYG